MMGEGFVFILIVEKDLKGIWKMLQLIQTERVCGVLNLIVLLI